MNIHTKYPNTKFDILGRAYQALVAKLVCKVNALSPIHKLIKTETEYLGKNQYGYCFMGTVYLTNKVAKKDRQISAAIEVPAKYIDDNLVELIPKSWNTYLSQHIQSQKILRK